MSGHRLKERPRPVVFALICALSFAAGFLLGPGPGRSEPSSGRAQAPRAVLGRATAAGAPSDGGAAAGSAQELAPAAAESGSAGAPGLPGTPAWRAAARVNLTNWRETLFGRAMDLLKETARAASPHAQLQPEGHARFGLFSSFLTCPSREALSRVGGSGDGGKLVRSRWHAGGRGRARGAVPLRYRCGMGMGSSRQHVCS